MSIFNHNLFLIHNTTIMIECKVKSLSLFMEWSWVNTMYSIHQARKHPPKIDCLLIILMIKSWPLNIAADSGMPLYKIDCHEVANHDSLQVYWHHHICTVASYCNWMINRVLTHDVHSINYLQILLRLFSIRASKCMFWSASSLPWVESPSSHGHGCQVYLELHLFTACKITWSWPQCASPTHGILTSKYISGRTWSPPLIATPNILDHRLQVNLWVYSQVIVRGT
jgi:hypothetical protein